MCSSFSSSDQFNKLVALSQGKISREEVARICVAALASPNAVGKTFEVKTLQLVSKTIRTEHNCQLSLRES
jgi:hypothetical protein